MKFGAAALVPIVATFTVGCTPPSAVVVDDLRQLTTPTGPRTYRVTVPDADAGNSAESRRFPLVLAFHGAGGDSASMREITRLDETARREGFCVAYPDGIDGEWNDGRPGINEDVDDVGFVRALLDELRSEYPIDDLRIYATGLSNGGHLCYRLAFDLSDRIAAIAPVGALLSVALSERGQPPRPIPVLIIAGDADPISPYAGGVVGGALLDRGEVLSADAAIDFWIVVNRALTGAVLPDYNGAVSGDGTRVGWEVHPAAEDGAEVTLVTIEGGGHTWPGGGEYLPAALVGQTSSAFDASAGIWEFFARHRLGN